MSTRTPSIAALKKKIHYEEKEVGVGVHLCRQTAFSVFELDSCLLLILGNGLECQTNIVFKNSIWSVEQYLVCIILSYINLTETVGGSLFKLLRSRFPGTNQYFTVKVLGQETTDNLSGV